MIRYSILIEEGTETAAFGVAIPALPGCFSAGDTLDEALDAAKEAAAAWLDAALDAGTAIPAPSSLDAAHSLPGYAGWTIGGVELDLAEARHQSRGAFIADLTMRVAGESR
jgi:predicted RNase H-like HicB family nuclease